MKIVYDESKFYTEWSDELFDKLVIVGLSKKEVEKMLKDLNNGRCFLHNIDYVCPSGDTERPFCDMEDDCLWESVYYDSQLDKFIKSLRIAKYNKD